MSYISRKSRKQAFGIGIKEGCVSLGPDVFFLAEVTKECGLESFVAGLLETIYNILEEIS